MDTGLMDTGLMDMALMNSVLMSRGSTGVPEWVLPAALDGERVDRAVALLTGATRAAVADLVAAGGVRVGGHTVTTRARRVRTGEVLSAEVTPGSDAGADGLVADPSVEFSVIYEDDDIVVIDKPAGLVVHPGNGNRSGTLAAGLLARYPDLAALMNVAGAEYRPGIVHRLDKGTSGLLVVARTPMARRSLVGQLAAHDVERHYQALVGGRVEADEGLVDAPLARSDRDPTAMAVRLGGREARTRYRVEARYVQPVTATLLECRLETGRTHQIRVHLAAIGHPVVGDDRYDGTPPHATKPNRLLAPGRLWLHAEALEFSHPTSG
ncbi:MAG: RluA family pseudouridine synthase, partial [Acidimicrobiaceae bacterium]|nr:RluA family pseudouridine synthase [Acidimicrobiaceae bacterium]